MRVRADISPRQLAEAIGVSESSVKRWCDDGELAAVRTAGGHRRLPIHGVIDFLRRTGRPVIRPELLGLPAVCGAGNSPPSCFVDNLSRVLIAGDADSVRKITFDLYLGNHSLDSIFDELYQPAFTFIGQGWCRGEVEVYEERRAVEIALAAFRELREVQPLPRTEFQALGGTLEGDPYQLPTKMVELVLRQAGWRATSLGTWLPVATMIKAADTHQPDMVWLSCSHVPDEPQYQEQYVEWCEALATRGIPLVLGGRALTSVLRGRLKYTAFCDRMSHLLQFLRSFRIATA